ncbi:MAG: dynamin family protein [Proteobacteria bacterium]|nr:MAG: dynamin family protein [Pseudomonadota bacterium]
MTPAKRMESRIQRLKEHLTQENPELVEVVDCYQDLDAVARKMGLLGEGQSYTTLISWWPMISVLGTFSAGKSSFINTFLDAAVQRTGNQAVDDHFTVITYSNDGKTATLPGMALDGDPRFPFYQISEELDQVVSGEGAKIDNYLQMKVVPSEQLKGKILIDSPGFDADAQRKSILRIVDHIIDLSDLVMVFFDARHPEPGAMHDTLEHLVKGAQRRSDTSKFLFVLNQVDTSAREDNLEDIVASWQKALVQQGLSAGSFFIMFNEKLAQPVDNEQVWSRYVSKRNADHARMLERMDGVNSDRVYRIIGNMESLTNQIEQQTVPHLQALLKRWRRYTLIWDSVVLVLLLAVLIGLSVFFGLLQGMAFTLPSEPMTLGVVIIIPLAILVFMHFVIRGKVANRLAGTLNEKEPYGNLQAAFRKSTSFLRSIFQKNPAGWGSRARNRLDEIRYGADRLIQRMNDHFTQSKN